MRIDPTSASPQAQDTKDRYQAKLVTATQQFEGMLLEQMLKPLQSSENKWDTKDEADKTNDTLSSYGVEALATSISKAGGLGIAKSVLRKVQLEDKGRIHAGNEQY
jgi:flagellar protein FlgJ